MSTWVCLPRTELLILPDCFDMWLHALFILHYSKPAMNTDVWFFCQSCPLCLLLKPEWLHIMTPWGSVTICCLCSGDVAQRCGQKWLLIIGCFFFCFSFFPPVHGMLQKGKAQIWNYRERSTKLFSEHDVENKTGTQKRRISGRWWNVRFQ